MVSRPDAAVSAYKLAIKHNPSDASSLSALGDLFDELGENPEISAMFSRHSVEIEPENGLFRNRLGLLYLKQDRLQEAMEEFVLAKRFGHDSTEQIKLTQHRLFDENKEDNHENPDNQNTK